MYDYISLQANSDFSVCIDLNQLKKVFSDIEGFQSRSDATGVIQFGEFKIVLQGIKCDNNGHYAFDNDSVFEEINLIEINIRQGADLTVEDKIRQVANDLRGKLGWQIDWRTE